MDKRETIRLIMDFWHRAMMHHAIWYGEVIHHYGREKAWEILQVAFKKSRAIQLNRLGMVMGFDMEGDIPKPFLELPERKLEELKEAVAINWLANDGVWLQAVEFSKGMPDAKRCNDSSWAQFSPFEARSIKQLLNLGARPGLEGLKKALGYRLYATINKQSILEESEHSFVFQMNECRVQAARQRKGLDDYPCKSGGIIEYTSFAETIDPGITTECISCPPDPHPAGYHCMWRFSTDS